MGQTIFTVMIWGGAFVTLTGVFGLLLCGKMAMAAKTMEPEAAKAQMQRVIWMNLAAMGLAVLGLMVVVAGLFLR